MGWFCVKIKFKKTGVREGVMAEEARCMKCKKQVEVKNPKNVLMKNGMMAISGLCSHCATKVFKIVGKNK
jgi:hypothetical protein